MYDGEPNANEGAGPEPERPTRRRIVRAAGGGVVAVLTIGLLAACGGDDTGDEGDGDD